MRRSVCLAQLLMLLLFSWNAAALAQQPVGSIEGTVTDPSGAVIAGAAVTITERTTGRVINTKTNAEGFFEARALLPAKYSVKIQQTGFNVEVLDNVTVLVGQVANASATLKVGAAQEVVSVSADTEIQVDTTRQTVDGVIKAQQIDELPLNGRNFLDLAVLEPSVNVRDGGTIDPTKTFAFRTVGVDGRSGTATRVQIDGVDVTDETVGTTVANISDDAVSEFQLSRSSLDLSTSLTSSGAINVASRSGGNGYHGSVFYFGRNQDFSARNSPSQPGDNDPFHRHQVGFHAGGPFIKDKLFWFVNWERFYQADNFHTDPATVSFFPQMAGSLPLPSGIRLAGGRVDWNATSSIHLFYHFNHNWDISTGGTGQSPFQNIDWTNLHIVGADIIQSHLTHSIRFGYVNFNNNINSQELSPFKFNVTADGTPYFLGVGQYQLGPNGLAPQQTFQDNYQTKYDGSYVRGKHTFRFGGEVNRIILGGFANFAGPLTIGGDFSADPGGIRDQIIARGGDPKNPLEYPFNGFTMGPANGFFTVPPAHGFAHGGNYNTRLAWYAGDSFRLRHNLTLNFGTRWEYDTGYFNHESEDGARRPALLAQNFPPAGTAPHFPKDKFGPSFGFAYDPFSNGKTVIRGGVYLAYEMNIFNNTIFNEFALIPPGIGPDTFSEAFVSTPDGVPINIDGKHPDGNYSDLVGQPIKNVIDLISKLNLALQASYANHKFNPSQGQTDFEILKGNTFGGIFPGDYKIPYSLQFNIGVQRELGHGNVLSVDYVRLHGVGLPLLLEDYQMRRDASTLNVAAAKAKVASVLAGKTVDQWIAANPTKTITSFGLANDTIWPGKTPGLIRNRVVTGGFSLYSALQAKLVGRLSNKLWLFRNLSYQVAYAYGESLATCGSTRAEFVGGTCDNRELNNPAYFGNTPFSFRNNLTAGVIMETPGKVRISQIWSWRSITPVNLTVPAIGITGANAMFLTDLNGDGGTGTSPRGDILPGLGFGNWGRGVHSVSDLNKLLAAYNQIVAGNPTPEGQALIAAGIFTLDQLKKLKAVSPVIPLIPLTNPDPFPSAPFNIDVRITRPITIENARIVHNLRIEPYVDFFNILNRRGLSGIAGLNGVNALGTAFGSLNFDYAAAGRLQELRNLRAFPFAGRIVQLGFRVSF